MPQYKIYPTLLDAYAWYKKSDNPDAKQELIDKINRVPFESEAAAKGTAFNNLVDAALRNRWNSFYEDIIEFGNFEFKSSIVKLFVDELRGAIPQVKVQAEIETDNGTVLLYGFIDELLKDKCIDIKTTASYDFPKFLHNWQHIIYLYCLNEMNITCSSFQYLITDFNSIYKEDYFYKPDKQLTRLKAELNDFIFFLEMNRDLITDKKIFALDDVTIASYSPDDKIILID